MTRAPPRLGSSGRAYRAGVSGGTTVGRVEHEPRAALVAAAFPTRRAVDGFGIIEALTARSIVWSRRVSATFNSASVMSSDGGPNWAGRSNGMFASSLFSTPVRSRIAPACVPLSSFLGRERLRQAASVSEVRGDVANELPLRFLDRLHVSRGSRRRRRLGRERLAWQQQSGADEGEAADRDEKPVTHVIPPEHRCRANNRRR
jgi:hypothetical protein